MIKEKGEKQNDILGCFLFFPEMQKLFMFTPGIIIQFF